jgi:hypothetical protein
LGNSSRKSKMLKVYVVNRGTHDFSKAEKFGRLIYMTEGFQPKLAVSAAHRRFEFCMQESEQEDWILITGLSVLNCIACSIFALKHKRLNLLLFDGRRYVERVLIMGEKDD